MIQASRSHKIIPHHCTCVNKYERFSTHMKGHRFKVGGYKTLGINKYQVLSLSLATWRDLSVTLYGSYVVRGKARGGAARGACALHRLTHRG